MSVGDTTITVVGNLAADPELRFTTNGDALAKFSVASTPRSYDKNSGQWKDGTAMFLRCAAWRDLAQHIAETLTKGTRVVVTGRLRQHDWQTPEGEKRSTLALEVDDIGPSLRFATAKVERIAQTVGAPAPSADPWNTAGAPSVPATASGGMNNEAPF